MLSTDSGGWPVTAGRRPRPKIGISRDQLGVFLGNLDARIGTGRERPEPIWRRRNGGHGHLCLRQGCKAYRGEEQARAKFRANSFHGFAPTFSAATFSTSGSFQTLSKNSFFGA